MKYKTIKELDLLSYDEVTDYIINLVEKGIYSRETKRSSNDEYINELNVYLALRFKEDRYKQYDNWIEKAKNNEGDTITDKKTYKLLSEILSKENGKDIMFEIHIKSEFDKVVEFKYLFGLNYEFSYL